MLDGMGGKKRLGEGKEGYGRPAGVALSGEQRSDGPIPEGPKQDEGQKRRLSKKASR